MLLGRCFFTKFGNKIFACNVKSGEERIGKRKEKRKEKRKKELVSSTLGSEFAGP